MKKEGVKEQAMAENSDYRKERHPFGGDYDMEDEDDFSEDISYGGMYTRSALRERTNRISPGEESRASERGSSRPGYRGSGDVLNISSQNGETGPHRGAAGRGGFSEAKGLGRFSGNVSAPGNEISERGSAFTNQSKRKDTQDPDIAAEKRRGTALRVAILALLFACLCLLVLIILSLSGRSRDGVSAGHRETGNAGSITEGTASAETNAAGTAGTSPDSADSGERGTSSDAGTPDSRVSESGAAADSGESSRAEQAVYTSGTVDYYSATDEPATKEEALSSAAAYAMSYDYDRAIACIQNFSGYDSDADLTDAIAEYTADKATCTAVDVTTIPHIFFHSLLNDDRGLRADIVGEDRAWRNDAAMTTADEFDHMIEDMYEAGYVMVSLDDMCVKTTAADGSVTISKNQNLLLPEGKKAFVLSEDDLSYYHTYGEGTQGYATKMVLDENGQVKCEYTNEDGDTLIGDYDVVPRMDTFVREHPDFSYHGAKGTVALTGYNGIFGYRTNDYYKDINNPNLDPDQVEWLRNHPDFDWDQDVADATAIADAMKANGWTFASHTYGHLNAEERTADRLKADNERWVTVNEPIVGKTDKIIFAFGADIGPVNGYTADNEKYQYFKSQGYDIFCNVDGNIGWTEFGTEYMRTGRVPLDGFSMYQCITPDGQSHSTYAHDYEVLGITDVASFFNKYRITPIESE